MIVIYGHKWYGQAFSHNDQGIATRAFHLYYVPLIPAGQMWVASRSDGMVRGMATRWSWRAALPIFALQWTIIGLIIAASSPAAGILIAAAAAGLGIWGVVKSRLGARARTARELTARVLGTGCPPELLKRNTARDMASRLDSTWAKVCPDRPPEDVARLGPRDRNEGALAYTMLVVRASFETGALAKTLREQADQVLDALERAPQLPAGAPYRDADLGASEIQDTP